MQDKKFSFYRKIKLIFFFKKKHGVHLPSYSEDEGSLVLRHFIATTTALSTAARILRYSASMQSVTVISHVTDSGDRAVYVVGLRSLKY